jgi:hypothetical protein
MKLERSYTAQRRRIAMDKSIEHTRIKKTKKAQRRGEGETEAGPRYQVFGAVVWGDS